MTDPPMLADPAGSASPAELGPPDEGGAMDPVDDAWDSAPAALAPSEPPVDGTLLEPGGGDAAAEDDAASETAGSAPLPGARGYDEQGRPGWIHVVVRGDTLWDISDGYLGTPWVWPSIWDDNDDIANPHRIYPGDHIWISPWAMRRVTPEEADALLAGRPAAPDPGGPEIASIDPDPGLVREEQPTHRVSWRETVGLVSEEQLEAAASIVSAIPPRVMLGGGDRVYVGLGADVVAPGDEFTIFRTREKVFDPDTGRLLGYHVDLLGWAEIQEAHEETSLAEIRLSSAEIEIGDRLIPRPPPLEDIELQPSPQGVEGKISFFANSRTLMGSIDAVYLNRGTTDGVQVGSPLAVYRSGFVAHEPVRRERVKVPDRVVAQLLVVRAQDESAVAVVQHTEEELAVGDRFRGFE
jgi:hypothetical protein